MDKSSAERFRSAVQVIREMGRMSFRDFVRGTHGYAIFSADKELCGLIRSKLTELVGRELRGERSNDAGNALERLILGVLESIPGIKIWGIHRNGYPDFVFGWQGITVYLEVKWTAAGKSSKESRKDWYVHDASRIMCDAMHLIVTVRGRKVSNGLWEITEPGGVKDAGALMVNPRYYAESGQAAIFGLPEAGVGSHELARVKNTEGVEIST